MTHYVLVVANWINFGSLNFTNPLPKLIESYRRQRMVKRTMTELASLTNRELKDMGINRGDIYSIAMESVYDNTGVRG